MASTPSVADRKRLHESHDFLTHSDLSTELETMRAAMVGDVVSATTRNTAELLSKVESRICDRVARTEAGISDLQQVTNSLDKRLAAVESRQGKVETTVGLCASQEATYQVLDQEEWCREPNRAILRLNSDKGEQLPFKSVETRVREWLSGIGLSDEAWSLQGKELDNRWALFFHGAGGMGPRNASNANQALRNDNGDWTKVFVPSPTGSQVQVFVGPDKNPKRRALEAAYKRAARAIESFKPNVRTALVRSKGMPVELTAAHLPMCRIDADVKDTLEVYWCPETLLEFKVSKEDIKAKYESLGARKSSNANWCL